MATEETIRNRVTEILARLKNMDSAQLDLRDDDDFMDKLQIDSLDSVTLTMELGREFNFTFGERLEDLDALQSYGGLVSLIKQRA